MKFLSLSSIRVIHERLAGEKWTIPPTPLLPTHPAIRLSAHTLSHTPTSPHFVTNLEQVWPQAIELVI